MTIVMLTTNMGDIKIELDEQAAPKTVQNFLDYVKEGFYDGVIFHRVISNFMIQGGGFDQSMKQKQGKASIEHEGGALKNDRGTLAMARTNDPHSASSQFFINLVDNAFLNHKDKQANWGYCVFGKVIEGMDVVDKIKTVPTTSKAGHQDVPTTPVIIEKAETVE